MTMCDEDYFNGATRQLVKARGKRHVICADLGKEKMQKNWCSWMLMWISEGCLCKKGKIPLCLQWAVMEWLTQPWQVAVSVLCYLIWDFEQVGHYCRCAWILKAFSRRPGGCFLSLWGKQGRRSIEQHIHACITCCGSRAHAVRYKWLPILSWMAMRP